MSTGTAGPATLVTPEVLIVGGGPAGLTAARVLAGAHRRRVLVVERERQAGGIPRHCDHTGFGLRDLRRVLSGPSYAGRLVAAAEEAGAEIWDGATVTSWSAEHGAEVTTPRGLFTVRAGATVLATGARERSRPARMIPGDRPEGIYTTGLLQNLVHLHHGRVGEQAVILGAELVSWSAALTLRQAGCDVVAMVTAHERPESYSALTALGRRALRFPVISGHRVVRIIGRDRLEAVELENAATGRRRLQGCDTLVVTGDWVPDVELARSGGLDLDRVSRSPVVDSDLRTSVPGGFAAGNLIHPVDTADVAALDGRHVARPVLRWLDDPGAWPSPEGARVVARPPLRWISPGRVAAGAPPRSRHLSWVDRRIGVPVVTVTQDGRVLGRRRLMWPAAPGRVFRIPSDLFAAASPAGGDVVVEVDGRP